MPSIGGGLCQLSNAIYDVALRAGLQVVERHRHTQVVPGSLAESLQEALTNVFKHSRAQRVEVRIERSGDRLHLQVRDDGVGLPAQQPTPAGGGAGFASMRLRAQRLGGMLQVESVTGGTDLRLEIPLPA